MELEQFMTATEFAEKVNTAYPTVAKWLREGKVPGAFRQRIGNMEIWMIPGDVLKDFVRPKMGRPKKHPEGGAKKSAAKKSTKKTTRG
jgi:hypothetical protein